MIYCATGGLGLVLSERKGKILKIIRPRPSLGPINNRHLIPPPHHPQSKSASVGTARRAQKSNINRKIQHIISLTLSFFHQPNSFIDLLRYFQHPLYIVECANNICLNEKKNSPEFS